MTDFNVFILVCFFVRGILIRADECKTYAELRDADRKTSFSNERVVKCDSSLTKRWYRFSGNAGSLMPESCVATWRCGTHAPGWLNGQHPTAAQGIVTRDVCYHWTGNCCRWKNSIRVRNCGAFFVYKFQRTPGCSMRYCGTSPPEESACRTLNFDKLTKGKRLLNHVIQSKRASSEDWCKSFCLWDNNCVSVNFRRTKDSDWKHLCELNDAYKEQHTQDLKNESEFNYLGTKNPCKHDPCKGNEICQTGFGCNGYRCICPTGYTGDACHQDINECDEYSPCHVHARCTNTPGSYVCNCSTGHQGNGIFCEDIDECSSSSPCHANAKCFNTRGSYVCKCSTGYRGNGSHCEGLTFKFTTLGSKGRQGPTNATGYKWTLLESVQLRVGLQEWTVPVSGKYKMEVCGASGGNGNHSGGKGAKASGEIRLSKGTVLTLLVGQQGQSLGYSNAGSGGGGTFIVYNNTKNPLVIVGGGGGGNIDSGDPGQEGSNGSVHGGSAGSGGGACEGNLVQPDGGSGGGFFLDGCCFYGAPCKCTPHEKAGRSFSKGGEGGNNQHVVICDGGFGGGGAYQMTPGGGGGFSGGGVTGEKGGGGGSFRMDKTWTIIGGVCQGDGYATIRFLNP